MGLFSILKRNSKLAMKGSWGRAIIILLIMLGVTVLLSVLQQVAMQVFVIDPTKDNPTMEPYAVVENFDDMVDFVIEEFSMTMAEIVITSVFTILSLLLMVPLVLGITRWYFAIVHGNRMPIAEIFHFYESGKMYRRAIWYDINITFRCFFWSILCFVIPSAILGVSVYYLTSAEELPRTSAAIASTGIFIAAVLFLLAGIFYYAIINRYMLVPYLISESDNVTVGQAIKTSVKYTKGFRFSLVWFSLSFIGWILLAALVFPLLLYVIPYYYTAISMYARYIIEKNRFAESDATREFSAAAENAEIQTGDAPAAEELESPAVDREPPSEE